MQVNYNVLNQEGAPAIFEGDTIPPAGFPGRLFFSTNNEGIFYDNGVNWNYIVKGNLFAPTLQDVTNQGNSTTEKILLINNETTVDALGIQLANDDNVGINIFGTSLENKGIVIALDSGIGIQINNTDAIGIYSVSYEGTSIHASSYNNFGIFAQSQNLDAGYFISNFGNGIQTRASATGTNFAAIFGTNGTFTSNPLISFQQQTTYTGAANPAAEYLPIDINGTIHLLRLFSPI